MSRSLRAWLLSRRGRKPARPHAAPRRTVVPQLLTLEDRTLLSTFVVTSNADSGPGSLRQVMLSAAVGENTIVFAVTGTITLESALPDVNTNMKVKGPGAQSLTLLRDPTPGTPDFTIMAVDAPATVAISGLTLANGSGFYGGAIENDGTLAVTDCFVIDSAAWRGGALINFGTLTVTDSTISSNTAANNGGAIANFGSLTVDHSILSGNSSSSGGALYNFYAATADVTYSTVSFNHATFGGAIANNSGTVTVDSSTVAFNTADIGGGLANLYGSTAIVINSTFAGNAATYSTGGGIDNEAGAVLDVFNSTFSGNTAINGSGGAIANAGAMATFDTILARNLAPFGSDVAGDVGSLGHNLIANAEGGTNYSPTDLLYADPQILPLQDNGGPTLTMALSLGSPAIAAGDTTNAPAFDQRGPGFARVVDGAIDIGAFESQFLSPGTSSHGADATLADAAALISNTWIAAPTTVRLSKKVRTARLPATPAQLFTVDRWSAAVHSPYQVSVKKFTRPATPAGGLGLFEIEPLI